MKIITNKKAVSSLVVLLIIIAIILCSHFGKIPQKGLAESYLKQWYFWATHSKLGPIIAVAKTLKAHWNGIVNYFEFPISNGILEAFNGLIQSTKTAARGIRSMKYFIAMIYLRLGRLDFNLPT